jgi:hypothetical protein
MLTYSLLDVDNNPKWTDIEAREFYATSISKIKNTNNETVRQNLDIRQDMAGFSETKGGLWVLMGSLVGLAALLSAIGEPE